METRFSGLIGNFSFDNAGLLVSSQIEFDCQNPELDGNLRNRLPMSKKTTLSLQELNNRIGLNLNPEEYPVFYNLGNYVG